MSEANKKYTYHIITFGCQMNHSDSERLAGMLEACNVFPAKNELEADIIFINACSVRQSAIDRIWGKLRHLTEENAKRPPTKKLYTALTGCVYPADRPKFTAAFDLYFPMKDLPQLPALIHTLFSRETVRGKNKDDQAKSAKADAQKKASRQLTPEEILAERQIGYHVPQIPLTEISQVPSPAVDHYLQLKPKYTHPFAVSVPIMTGCNAFCTYCAVPFTRGREVSRKAEEILSEISALLSHECKEISLQGQIINKWVVRSNEALAYFLSQLLELHGSSWQNVPELSDQSMRTHKLFKFHHLLAVINELKGDFWLRFLSSHPKWFSDELVDTIARCEKIPKHIHLPIQAGSDTTLRRMLRPYTVREYTTTIHKIRHALPDASISTDCIVGFCGETTEEFEETCRLFETVRFDMAFIAEYSPRPGTKAARTMSDDVPHQIKEERRKKLTDILRSTALEKNHRMVDSVIRVLTLNKKTNGLAHQQTETVYLGRTENFKNIQFTAPVLKHNLVGKFANVRVTSAHPWSLAGKLIPE